MKRLTCLVRLSIATILLGLSGCALQGVVERQSVEYNAAAAGMANQLTLLNILRAEEGLPIYYTSIARLTGSTQVTASAGFNAQLKSSSPTDTTGSTTTNLSTTGDTLTKTTGTSTTPTIVATAIAPSGTTTTTTPGGTTTTTSQTDVTPLSSVATTVANAATHAVTSGGNMYTPTVGGQIVSGPSFDINILDTQQFYQGVLQEISFSTVETFIDQEFDNQLLMRLLIERFEFRVLKPVGNYNHPAGYLVATLHNHASGIDDTHDEAGVFANFVACYALSGASQSKPPKLIAPLSRVTKEADGKVKPLTISDLALFDGNKLDVATQDPASKKLDLEGYIGSDAGGDKDVYVVRTSQEKRSPRLDLLPDCTGGTPKIVEKTISDRKNPELSGRLLGYVPKAPPAEPTYAGNSETIVVGDDRRNEVRVPTQIDVIFRSPEGVIRYLGRYLSAAQQNKDHTYTLGGYPLFRVQQGRGHSPLVSADLLGKHYYIEEDDAGSYRRYMTIVGLIEELVNLQKSSAEHPATVPVHVLP